MIVEDADNFQLVRSVRSVAEEEAMRTEAAVLNPNEPGGLSSAERLAFASRIARLADNYRLADLYQEQLEERSPSAELLEIAQGFAPADARLAVLAEHVDLITVRPIDAAAEHIQILQRAGISDADIVRLTELVSFMSYRVRTEAALHFLEIAR